VTTQNAFIQAYCSVPGCQTCMCKRDITFKGVGRKFSGGEEGATEKRPKISKKYRKIVLFGAQRKKRPKNNTF